MHQAEIWSEQELSSVSPWPEFRCVCLGVYLEAGSCWYEEWMVVYSGSGGDRSSGTLDTM